MLRMLGTMGVTLVLLVGTGCEPGLGERCNPQLFSDECAAGNASLSCVYPANCGVAFCCPTSGSTTDPNCQACPGDGGVDASSTD